MVDPAARPTARRDLIAALGVAIAGVVAVLLWASSGASAATISFGSTLRGAADTELNSGQDEGFWLTTLAPPAPTAVPSDYQASAIVPADGQILAFRLKGAALDSGRNVAPLTQVHFLDLAPIGGAVRIDRASGPKNVPVSTAGAAGAQQITSYDVENFCVHKGDFVSFATEGGFDQAGGYPNGVPYQFFSQVPGSTTDFYTKHADLQLGHQFAGAPVQNLELLMQAQEAIGSSVSRACHDVLGTGSGIDDNIRTALTLRGPITQGPNGELDIPLTAPPDTSPTNPASWDACADRTKRPNCPAATGARASRISIAVTAAGRVYGKGSLSTTTPGPTTLRVNPTKAGRRMLRHHGTLKVAVHLAFRTSSKLGSTSKTKDFKIKVKGRKHH